MGFTFKKLDYRDAQKRLIFLNQQYLGSGASGGLLSLLWVFYFMFNCLDP